MASRWLLALIAWSSVAAYAADAAVYIRPALVFEANPLMDPGARAECGGFADFLSKRIVPVLLEGVPGARVLEGPAPTGSDWLLSLQVADSRGGDTGSTNRVNALLSIRADLYQGSRLAATRIFQRRSGTLGAQDLCAVKEKIATAVAKDVTLWLKGAVNEASDLFVGAKAGQPALSLRRFFIQAPAMFDASSAVPQASRTECQTAQYVTRFTYDRVARRFPEVRPVTTAQLSPRDRVLTVTVTELASQSSGSSSAGRSVAVRADVSDDSKVLATQTISKQSSMAPEACLNVSRATQLIADDLGPWVSQVFAKPDPASDR